MQKTPITEIHNLLVQAAEKYVDSDEAAYFADLWLETHMKKAPRMNPIEEAVDELTVWSKNPSLAPETVVTKPGIRVINCHGLGPSLKIKEIHDDLAQRAKSNGIAAMGFYNSSGVITLNLWADGLAKRDLIGIAMFNGGTQCAVPFGGTRGVFGTNPLAYAIPTLTQPIVLDMATTEIPFFEIKTAKEQNIPLKENAAVDNTGLPTTQADKALTDDGAANLLPMGGGFKGYGIMMLVEILTGSLVRSMLSHEQQTGWHPSECGCMLMAIDIAGFTDLDTFKTTVSQLCTSIRNEPPADGFESVVIPGDRGHAKLKTALDKGTIEIDTQLLNQLEALAQ